MSGLSKDDVYSCHDRCERPVCVAARAAARAATRIEREKVAEWMIQRSYATGHGETIEDLLAELDWQIVENWNRAMINGMKTEREACAKLCDEMHSNAEDSCGKAADAIRARGQG